METIKQSPDKDRKKSGRIPRKITESYLHNAGLFYLQRFAASTAHFRKVMMRKIDRACKVHEMPTREECIRMLDTLIEKFQRSGLLDDEVYTQSMVSSLRRKGNSQRLIHSKLAAKGLDKELISRSLEKYDDEHGEEGDLLAALRFARRKRFGVFGQSKEEDKALAAFARAGFSYNVASQALNMSLDEAEEAMTLSG